MARLTGKLFGIILLTMMSMVLAPDKLSVCASPVPYTDVSSTPFTAEEIADIEHLRARGLSEV